MFYLMKSSAFYDAKECVIMKKGFLSLTVMMIFASTLLWSIEQPVIFVRENTENNGTHLEIFDPTTNNSFQITGSDEFYRISFPVVNEKMGLVGFTEHGKDMKAAVYLFDPESVIPRKAVDNAILEDISPDGQYLLLSSASSSPSLYLFDFETLALEKITQGYTVNSAVYSPDGTFIVFAAMNSSGKMDLYRMNLSDRQITPLVTSADRTEYFPSFTQDGQYLMFMTDRTGQWGVDYLDLETDLRYQANLWGMYPRLSANDVWTVMEKDSQITVGRTTGKEFQTLFDGLMPNWISYEIAGRFIGTESVGDTAGLQNIELIASRKIGVSGGTVDVKGLIQVEIPSGTFDGPERELNIYTSEIENVTGKIFELELSDSPELFSQFVEITIPLDEAEQPEDFFAVDEIEKDVWVIVPSEYDPARHAMTFKTAHFSKKGIISEIGPKQVRKLISGAFGSIGSGIGFVIIAGSAEITLPALGVMVVGGYLLSQTGFMDPAVDKGYELLHGLNRTFVIDDGISVSWVDDPGSPSHLGGEKYLVCVEKETNKILFAVNDKDISPEKRAAAMKAILPFSDYILVNIPKVILELAVEMKVVKNYYKQHGYAVPPETDIWIYKMSTAGGWNGSKLEIDLDYFEAGEKTKASRITVLAHEYWHSVYQYNGYSPEFKWLDECLATSFEGQVNPEGEKIFSQNILPRYEHFYDMYRAEKVAQSLKTGFVFDGETGTDADRIKRGYQLWPWGKYLLATQGHEEIQNLLKGTMKTEMLSSYFENFCKAILIQDFAVDDLIAEDLPFERKKLSYETVSGWSALNVKSFLSNSLLVPGNSGAHLSGGVFRQPVPLSLTMIPFKADNAPAGATLVIRRNVPDEREEYLTVNPSALPDAAGRYRYDAVINDEGILVIPSDWTRNSSLSFNLTIINCAVEENWSEYFGYGQNSIYAYFLKKPEAPQLKEITGKLLFSWEVPDFGYGLSAAHCLSGYHIYLTDEGLKKTVFLMGAGAEKNAIELNYTQLAGYDRIGIASVDKYAKDDNGKALISEINWIPIKMGSGTWVKVDESFGYVFGRDFYDSVEGNENTAEYSTGVNTFKYRITTGSAETLNTNTSVYTGGGETASFKHSWTKLPDNLSPGQMINQVISVMDNGSSGKNAMSLYGSTSFEIIGENPEAVEAGGSLYKNYGSWKAQDSRQFNWTVPEPDYMQLTYPKQNHMKIGITVKSESSELTRGYYTAEYEYRP